MGCGVRECKARIGMDEKRLWDYWFEIWSRGNQCDPDSDAVKRLFPPATSPEEQAQIGMELVKVIQERKKR